MSDIEKSPDWPFLEEGISNFDREIPYGLENGLRSNKVKCHYAAWDFHGEVWFDGNVFKCMIERYKIHIATIEGKDLDEIMLKASDEYGWD